MNVNFNLPPEEALEYFRAKGLKKQFAWQDAIQREHTAAFMVAKMMDLDLLADVRAAVDDALAKGTTLRDFERKLRPMMVDKGWWGKKEMTDPITGELREVKLGSPRRLRTIFDVNLSSAYAAGHWQKIKANEASAPYLLYNAVDDGRTRPLHRSWDEKVLRVDDPFWRTHYPPNGWRCRCSVIQLNDDDLKGMGKTGPDSSPEFTTYNWVNPRTGEIVPTPNGIDPGWAYNVGESYLSQLGKQFAEKVGSAPADLAVATWRNSVTTALAPVEAAFGEWVDDVFATGVKTGRTAMAGVLGPEDLAYLNKRGVDPVNAGILVEDRLLVGKKAERHEEVGNALTSEEWKSLPAALAIPEAVLWDVNNQTLLYVFPSNDKRVGKLAVLVNTQVKKQGVNNIARSGFKVKPEDLRSHINKGDYVVVRGDLEN